MFLSRGSHSHQKKNKQSARSLLLSLKLNQFFLFFPAEATITPCVHTVHHIHRHTVIRHVVKRLSLSTNNNREARRRSRTLSFAVDQKKRLIVFVFFGENEYIKKLLYSQQRDLPTNQTQNTTMTRRITISTTLLVALCCYIQQVNGYGVINTNYSPSNPTARTTTRRQRLDINFDLPVQPLSPKVVAVVAATSDNSDNNNEAMEDASTTTSATLLPGGSSSTVSSSSSNNSENNLPPVIQDIVDERRIFQLNLGKAMDTLQKDLPDIIHKKPDYSIYDENIRVVDDSGVRLTSLEQYKNSVNFLQTFIKFWFQSHRSSGLQLRLVYDWARSSIRVSWHLILYPKFLGKPLHVDGISMYKLSPESGKIIEHKFESFVVNNTPVAPPYGIFSLLQKQDLLGMSGVHGPGGVPVPAGVGLPAGI